MKYNKLMKRKLLFGFSLLVFAMGGSAQTQFSGSLDVAGGIGHANPWAGGMKLELKKEGKFLLSPFMRAYGINRNSSGMTEDIDFTYSGIMPLSQNAGNQYTSHRRTSNSGWGMQSGVTVQFTPDRHNLFKVDLVGEHVRQSLTGCQDEKTLGADGSLLSSVQSSFDNPTTKDHSLSVTALYQYKTNLEGEVVSLQYKYAQDNVEERVEQKVDKQQNFSAFQTNSLFSEAHVKRMDAQLDWHRPVAKGQSFDLGARYEGRNDELSDLQRFDGKAVVDEGYEHSYHTVGAFAAYNLRLKSLTAMARLEYDYTRQQGNDLSDLVPTARVQWQMSKKNSLTALYGRRIIRPTYDYLNPAHIRTAYTEYYGNPDLVGMHANNVQLAYQFKTQPVDFSATLQHIFANDGFNAIWMERDNVRLSTWGNEGKRRAWGLTPDVKWRPSAQTTLEASATVLWDKRVADAIHMAKEHWGVTAHVGLKQMLPFALLLNLAADYAEGNTIDLYSHAGRSVGLNAGLQHTFCNFLTVALDYRFNEHPQTVLTQGGYTGKVHLRPTNQHAAVAKVSVKF